MEQEGYATALHFAVQHDDMATSSLSKGANISVAAHRVRHQLCIQPVCSEHITSGILALLSLFTTSLQGLENCVIPYEPTSVLS